MASNYTGDPTKAATVLSLMTDGDRPSAQSVRVPLERLLDNDAKALRELWDAGADNAGGATITLGAGHVFNLITSTTAITAFAFSSDDRVGRSAIVRFDTTRVLTHNASTLILPGGSNIVTAQGDRMQITRTSAGFSVDWYTRAAVEPLAIATQAEQEAAINTVKAVTPGRQHYHPSAAKFWAYVTVSAGVPSIAASYNVTSVVDDAVGVLSVIIATDFSGANWAPQATFRSTTTPRSIQVTSQNAGSITATVFNSSTAAAADPDAWSVVGYGDQ